MRKYPHLIGGHAGADPIAAGTGSVPVSTNQTAIYREISTRFLHSWIGRKIFVPRIEMLHCKKRLAIFQSPAGMSLTKLSLAGNNLIMTLVTSRLGTGKSLTFFTVWSCMSQQILSYCPPHKRAKECKYCLNSLELPELDYGEQAEKVSRSIRYLAVWRRHCSIWKCLLHSHCSVCYVSDQLLWSGHISVVFIVTVFWRFSVTRCFTVHPCFGLGRIV